MRAAHALRRQAQAGTPRIPADAPPPTPLPDDPCLWQTQGQAGDRAPRRCPAQDSGRPPVPPSPGQWGPRGGLSGLSHAMRSNMKQPRATVAGRHPPLGPALTRLSYTFLSAS